MGGSLGKAAGSFFMGLARLLSIEDSVNAILVNVIDKTIHRKGKINGKQNRTDSY